jgi:predicted Zn finger-like uncharacterized protein
MRLTCPTCAAVYELPDDQLPAGGSHVQCTACHTRWFARARPPAAEPPSEDEIIARLETRSARTSPTAPPRPIGAGVGGVGGGAGPIAFPTPMRPRPAATAEAAGAAEAPLRPRMQPVDVPPAPEPTRTAEQAPTPLRPRAAEPGVPAPAPRPTPAAAGPARRRGGAAGFLLALALAAAAGALYLRAEEIASRLPAAEPALAAYAERVDAARVWIETTLGPLRDRAAGA